jgi:hypothetical protein
VSSPAPLVDAVLSAAQSSFAKSGGDRFGGIHPGAIGRKLLPNARVRDAHAGRAGPTDGRPRPAKAIGRKVTGTVNLSIDT